MASSQGVNLAPSKPGSVLAGTAHLARNGIGTLGALHAHLAFQPARARKSMPMPNFCAVLIKATQLFLAQS